MFSKQENQVLTRVGPGTPMGNLLRQYWHPIDEQGNWTNLEFTFNQDYMPWASQGPVAERNREKLGESDKGIILYRRLIKQKLDRMAQGDDPMNVFRDAAAAGYIALPLEHIAYGVKNPRRPNYVPAEAGWSADRALIDATLATWDQVAPAVEGAATVLP